MDTEEIRDRAYQVASSDPDPARRAKARRLLQSLPAKQVGGTPENHTPRAVQDEVTLQPGQKDYLHGLNIDPRLATALNAVGKYGGSATLGASDYLNDLGDAAVGRPGASQANRRQFDAEHPLISGTAAGLGAVTGGPTKFVAGAVDRGISSLAAASPKLRAVLEAPFLGSAVRGAAVGGTLGAGQGVLESSDHPVQGGLEGLRSGAKFGAGLGVLADAAGQSAELLSNDDIKLLEKYGLEPSPLPGTPVTKQGETLSAIREPPTGTNTATPKTRQTAAIKSTEELAGGISEIEGINNAHLGKLRARNNIEHGRPPHVRGTNDNPDFFDSEEPTVVIDEPVTNAQEVYGNGTYPRSDVRQPLSLIDAMHLRTDLPKATKGRLGEVRSELERISDPATMEANPVDVQGVKALTRHLGNQDRIQGVTASDEALRRVARSVNETLPPEMQAQDRAYAQARKRTEAAKRALGLRTNGTIPTEVEDPLVDPTEQADEPGQGEIRIADPNIIKTGANNLRRRGEDTAAGGNAEFQTNSLYQNGMPRVMVGAEKPIQLSVRSLMDTPSLQAAQERLQLNPSAVFSGSGTVGAPARAVKAGARRFVYPVLKDVSNLDTGRFALIAPDLVTVYRERQRVLDEEERRRRPANPYPVDDAQP